MPVWKTVFFDEDLISECLRKRESTGRALIAKFFIRDTSDLPLYDKACIC